MKCPKCRSEMKKKKTLNNSYYYECDRCFYNLGKPTKGSETDGKKEETAAGEEI